MASLEGSQGVGQMQHEAPRGDRQERTRTVIGGVAAVCVLLSACATEPPAAIGTGRGMSCVDDSAYCIAERKTALNNLVTRSDRHWVNDRPSVHAYASGVRLFAFKQKKSQLSCQELAMARREADGAPGALAGPDARLLSPAQVARSKMLAAEVSREIAREQGRRCRRG
ncbi:MAG: hypothetical protein AB7E80_13720 [Hyphomicrobiaceae bacterium]